jgi:hypothetical protein
MEEKRSNKPTGDGLHKQWFAVLCVVGVVLGAVSLFATYQQLGTSLFYGGGSEGVVAAAMVLQAEFVVFSILLLGLGLRKPERVGRYVRYMMVGLVVFVLIGCGLTLLWMRLASWVFDY